MRVAKLAINQGMEVRICTLHESRLEVRLASHRLYCGEILFLELCLFSHCVIFRGLFDQNFLKNEMNFFIFQTPEMLFSVTRLNNL